MEVPELVCFLDTLPLCVEVRYFTIHLSESEQKSAFELEPRLDVLTRPTCDNPDMELADATLRQYLFGLRCRAACDAPNTFSGRSDVSDLGAIESVWETLVGEYYINHFGSSQTDPRDPHGLA